MTDDIRERHFPVPPKPVKGGEGDVCVTCDEDWPCDAEQMARERDEQRERAERAEAEVAVWRANRTSEVIAQACDEQRERADRAEAALADANKTILHCVDSTIDAATLAEALRTYQSWTEGDLLAYSGQESVDRARAALAAHDERVA
jgi:hypothetical protein